jgi:hypothetical protein
MSHQPETPTRYVCAECQVIHAGTPIHVSAGDHTFEPPETCGGCDGDTFVEFVEWVRHHD